MTHEFWAAIALVLIIEGILPFLSPGAVRKAWQKLLALDDASLRMVGLAAMLSGVALLYWIN